MGKGFPFFLALFFAFSSAGLSIGDDFVTGFENPSDLQKLVHYGEANHIRRIQNQPGVTEGSQALAVDFDLSTLWPTILFSAEEFKGSSFWDWSDYKSLSFDLTNPSSDEISFSIRTDDGDSPANWDYREGTIPPHTTRTYRVYLENDPWAMVGIRRDLGTIYPGVLALAFWPSNDIYHLIDRSHLKRFLFFTNKINPTSSSSIRTLIFDRFRATNEFEIEPPKTLVDRFGQLSTQNWPEKIHSESDLIEDGKKDIALFNSSKNPSIEFGNRFRGWGSYSKNLRATGKFRTEKIDGAWWFVTPDGKPYYSSGIVGATVWNGSVIGPSTGNSPNKKLPSWLIDRAQLFEPLPEGVPFFRQFFVNFPLNTGEAARLFHFMTANLAIKYSPFTDPTPTNEPCIPGFDHHFFPEDCPFVNPWGRITMDRQWDMGFTSFGAWTSPALTRSDHLKFMGIENRLPFPTSSEVIAFNPHKLGPKNHDPYTSDFQNILLNRLKFDQEESGCTNEWCIGYFVDNELYWGSPELDNSFPSINLIPFEALALDGSQSKNAKTEFVNDLKKTYPNFGAFAKAWNPNLLKHFSDWDSFLSGNVKQALAGATEFSDALKNDFSKFLRKTANKYYTTVKNALTTLDPNRLYLCSRFADIPPRVVLEEAARICDVVSINLYYNSIDSTDWKNGAVFREVLDAFNKPALVGEFHFGALDRGHLVAAVLPGLKSASLEEKAERYRLYEERALKDPRFIGAHWFQWHDQVVSGRLNDFEAFNIGFITVGDRLYEPMREAAFTFHTGLYERRNSYAQPPSSDLKPKKFRLSQNYPNPFRSETKIDFDVPVAGNVKITLFDLLGKEVAVLLNEYKSEGKYQQSFHLGHLSSGTYFYQMDANGFKKSLKMVLIK